MLHLMEAHDWHPKEEEKIDAHLDELTSRERESMARVAPIAACDEDEESLLCRRYLVYVAAVREVRKAVAATLDELQDIGALEDTVVILYSDHGEEFSDHAETGIDPLRLEGYSDSYPRRYGHGHKMYEEMLHVPLMIWHPDYDGAEIDQPVSLVDIAPSAARWLGMDFSPRDWPGYYLEAAMESSPELAERTLFASSISYGEEQVSIRRGDRKSIWYEVSDGSEFFDLQRDPGERKPLSAPPWALQFDGYLLDYVDSKPRQPSKSSELTEQQIRQLQSIGYMQKVEVGESAAEE
ncbi:MAG: sulfatase-like hydrolase/transferase [Halioglobus sp.]|nr:sulfatase-like hydrolase/transferase [Halioglobus sp.]